MKTENKLKKLAAAESDFNAANNAKSAAWDAYTAAEKVYGDARAASKFINDACDAARSDFVAAAVALDVANKVVKDAEQVINDKACFWGDKCKTN